MVLPNGTKVIRTAGACMLPVPSRARASSEQLYCCLTRLFVVVRSHSIGLHTAKFKRQVQVATPMGLLRLVESNLQDTLNMAWLPC